MNKSTRNALARSRAYADLARSFWFPKDASIAKIGDKSNLDFWIEYLNSFDLVLPQELTALWHKQELISLQELQLEYDRLFTHRTEIVCPIYEAEYEKHPAISLGPTLSDIAGFYRAFGLEVALSERPDHLALELEYMSTLAYKESIALETDQKMRVRLCRDAQRKFLDTHLGRWFGLFARILSTECRSDFFAAQAILLEHFIQTEIDRLKARPHVISEWKSYSEPEEVQCPIATQVSSTNTAIK